ncbi:GNAT family N-acetyltransferase [Streptomyces liangshanensis]|uniref:GNAT family N-acetyltransferase n=1 Tax=Streptomyces liangshanensis TaxID=2717324 RepID=A0A6G9H2B5_9ACTN|nr:GNAT family N-acetyltransferase [Streptomyces liangshanensis]QIQ04682.1 GNAT family N-acetyltransferase [Streptomyces liangshanensis]
MGESLTRAGYTTRPMRPADMDAVMELLMLTSAWDIRYRLREQLRAAAAHDAHLAFVAEREGDLVGAAKLAREPAFPGTASALVSVGPQARGTGIGTALAGLLEEGAGRLRGSGMLTCTLRDDLPEGRAFAEGRGFRVTNHSVGRLYELPAHGERLAGAAARSATLARVSVRAASMEDEARTIMECVSRCMEGAKLPFQEGQDINLDHARRLIPAEAVIMLAESLDGSEPVTCGLTIMTPQGPTDPWYTIFTGVDARYRGRGIAAAVKSAALLYAYRAGADCVVTHNDETNEPILRLNDSLGMKPALGYWGLVRPLSD